MPGLRQNLRVRAQLKQALAHPHRQAAVLVCALQQEYFKASLETDSALLAKSNFVQSLGDFPRFRGADEGSYIASWVYVDESAACGSLFVGGNETRTNAMQNRVVPYTALSRLRDQISVLNMEAYHKELRSNELFANGGSLVVPPLMKATEAELTTMLRFWAIIQNRRNARVDPLLIGLRDEDTLPQPLVPGLNRDGNTEKPLALVRRIYGDGTGPLRR